MWWFVVVVVQTHTHTHTHTLSLLSLSLSVCPNMVSFILPQHGPRTVLDGTDSVLWPQEEIKKEEAAKYPFANKKGYLELKMGPFYARRW